MSLLAPSSTLSVSQLNQQVAQLLQSHLGRVWVVGEISNFTQAASGHWYFTIKDSQAAVKAVMFRGRAHQVGFMPKVGEKYRFYATVTLYEPRGDYQLQVLNMEPAGLGNLYAEFERLKNKLKAEGLFEPQHRLALLRMPRKIGVISSLKAAALHDVLTTMRRRAPHIQVYIYPAAVQGAEAADQLCTALEKAIADQHVQTILLVRGGGSLEDLWSFNNERLARLVYASPIPVISGVGHETDSCLVDFVADQRAPTPTAAAEMCCQSQAQAQADLNALWQRLNYVQRKFLEQKSLGLDYVASRLVSPQQRLAHQQQQLNQWMQRLGRLAPLKNPQQQLQHLRHRLTRSLPNTLHSKQRLQHAEQGLLQLMHQQLKHKQTQLLAAHQALHALNPHAVLERGYAIVRNQHGVVIKSAAQAQPNELLNVQLAQGHILVKLKQKHELL